MSEKLHRFLNFLALHDLVKKGDSLLLGISGGPDSMAMLHLFSQIRDRLSLRLEVAHLHHGMRGEEAHLDASLVRAACEKLKIPFRLFCFDVLKFASGKKLSVEEAGRRIRRHFFSRYAHLKKLNAVALAHTSNDQAETVLLHLVRGAGKRGLSGIFPKNGIFIHPMLLFCRQEILELLRDHGVSYRHDSTNRDLRYSRNQARLEILPYLEEKVDRKVRENLLRTAEVFRDEEVWLEEMVEPLFKERFYPLGMQVYELCISPEEALPAALERRLVRKFLKTVLGSMEGIGFDEIEQTRGLLRKETGKRFLFSGNLLERVQKGLACSRQASQWHEEIPLRVPGRTAVSSLKLQVHASLISAGSNLGSNGREAFLDYHKVTEPLALRPWRAGDSFLLLGLGKEKKLHDYFVDRKIPRILRSRIPLVASSKRIVWIGGYDIDDRVKVTGHTREILHLKVMDETSAPRS